MRTAAADPHSSASLFPAFTFGLRRRAVRVAQRQQGHLDQLVEEQISLDQDKLGVFFYFLPLQGVFLVLHHAEDGQRAPCMKCKGRLCDFYSDQADVCFLPLLCRLLHCGLAETGAF